MPLTKLFFYRSAAASPQLSGRKYLFGGTKSLQATLFRQLLNMSSGVCLSRPAMYLRLPRADRPHEACEYKEEIHNGIHITATTV